MAKAQNTKAPVRRVEDEEKQKALKTAMDQIEKKFGKGAVMRLGENAAMNVECIKTGSLMLDIALGIGGIPKGRIVEIFGPESSGKTTVALHCVAEAQKAGGTAAFWGSRCGAGSGHRSRRPVPEAGAGQQAV